MGISWKQRLGAVTEIGVVFVALLAAAAVIGQIAVRLPPAFATPVQGLALWGAVGAGALLARRSGHGFTSLGLRAPASWCATMGWAGTALGLSWAGTIVLGQVIQHSTDWPPLDVGYIRQSIEGNTFAWLVWMLLVVWGSAAFGEELLSRGFVLDRLWTAGGRGRTALVFAMALQAVIFGLLHAVQGPTGIVLTAWVGLVFAGVWLASGRNLWAPILAHGMTDTISLTLIYAGVPLPGYIN